MNNAVFKIKIVADKKESLKTANILIEQIWLTNSNSTVTFIIIQTN